MRRGLFLAERFPAHLGHHFRAHYHISRLKVTVDDGWLARVQERHPGSDSRSDTRAIAPRKSSRGGGDERLRADESVKLCHGPVKQSTQRPHLSELHDKRHGWQDAIKLQHVGYTSRDTSTHLGATNCSVEANTRPVSGLGSGRGVAVVALADPKRNPIPLPSPSNVSITKYSESGGTATPESRIGDAPNKSSPGRCLTVLTNAMESPSPAVLLEPESQLAVPPIGCARGATAAAGSQRDCTTTATTNGAGPRDAAAVRSQQRRDDLGRPTARRGGWPRRVVTLRIIRSRLTRRRGAHILSSRGRPGWRAAPANPNEGRDPQRSSFANAGVRSNTVKTARVRGAQVQAPDLGAASC